MLVPLATFPYLIRVLGKETYGLVIYAQVVVSYLQIIVNFGFNTSAVKEISVYRDDKSMLSEIISSIVILKSIFFFLSFIFLGIILFTLPQAKEHKLLFILSMWACFYDLIFPIWYFQGVEKMKYITYLTVVSRSIFLILVFVLISKPEHYLRLPLINGIGATIAGGLSLVVLYKYEKIRPVIPKFNIIFKHYLNSINFFISDVSVTIFASSNKLIIGTFLGLAELAYYDLAERIINIFRSIPLNIVKNTIYPKVSKTKNMNLVKMTTLIMSLYALLAILLINTFASSIILFFGGKDMLPSLYIVRIFSITILTTHLSNYYITIGLWSLGYDKVFRNLMIYSTVIFLFTYFIFWIFNIINLITITIIPIIVDVYLIFHIYTFWQSIQFKNHETKN
jgi:PST family polysaccharide transporter